MKELIFFFLYYGSATLVGILCGYLLEQYSRHLYAKALCICFDSEGARSIDDVVSNLKDRDIEFHVTF